MQVQPINFSAPILPFAKFAFLFNVPVLFLIFIVFFIFYAAVSAVLMYHWSAYGMRHEGILVAETLYLFISAVLFLMAGLALFYF
jgi:hypothetical protein